MATNTSLSDSFYRSRLTFPNHLYRSGGYGCSAYKQSPAHVRRIRLQTPRHEASDLRSKARQRPIPVSAAVAEQDTAHEASEGIEDTSQVQIFLQWLAIQGRVL